MQRPWRLLTLLLALPAGAQTVRVTAPVAVPLTVAPAAASAVLAAPISPALAAPALNAAPAASILAAPAAFAPALSAAPVAAAPAAVAAPAPAAALSAKLAAAADGPARPRDAKPAPSESLIAHGQALFDGASALVTRSGSVFNLSPTPVPAVPGGVAYVRVKAAPKAAVKPVADSQGLFGSALLARLGALAAQGQVAHSYHEASQYLFSTADNHTLNGVPGIADAYSGVFVPGTSADGRDYSETGDQSHDGYSRRQVMNVEHVFPQSLFRSDLPMRSDLHHLMATFEHPNGMRGSLPFGTVKNPTDYRNAAGAKRDFDFFEPPDFTKGRVARAMLYFYARYRGEAFFDPRVAAFWNKQVETLLDWNRRFPPTIEEARRNDHVERFQGNRNPFVDDYTLADKVGLEAWRDARAGGRVSPSPAPSPAPSEGPKRRSDKPRKGRKRQSFRRAFAPQFGRR